MLRMSRTRATATREPPRARRRNLHDGSADRPGATPATRRRSTRRRAWRIAFQGLSTRLLERGPRPRASRGGPRGPRRGSPRIREVASAWTGREVRPRRVRFDAQEGVDPRDDADGVAPQLVVLEGQIAGAGRRRPRPEGRHRSGVNGACYPTHSFGKQCGLDDRGFEVVSDRRSVRRRSPFKGFDKKLTASVL